MARAEAEAWTTEDRPEQAAARLVTVRDPEWVARFAAELDKRRSADDLVRVLSVWGLSQADAARLFGVSRQAVTKWLASGAPIDRAVAIADLAAATDLLVRYLRRERIPAVVRRPAAVTRGATLLELAGNDPRQVLTAVRAMFDFAAVST